MPGKVVKKILKDAEEKAKEILSDAKKQVADEIASAEEEAKSLIKQIKKQAEKLKEQEITKMTDMEMLEMRKRILAEKRKIMTEVYNKSLEKLISLDKKKYREFIISLIVRYFSSGDEEVLIGKEDKKLLSGIIDEVNKSKGLHLKASNEDAGVKKGVILKKGKVYTNLSLEALLKKVFEEMQFEIIKDLFKDVS